MRKLSDLLRTYNFVNTPDGRRYTVRFFTGLLAVAAGVVMTAVLVFAPTPGPGTDEATLQYGPSDAEPDRIYTTATAQGVYIGYPTAPYDAEASDRYETDAIDRAVDQWKQENPAIVPLIQQEVPIERDGQLLGYHLRIPTGLPDR